MPTRAAKAKNERNKDLRLKVDNKNFNKSNNQCYKDVKKLMLHITCDSEERFPHSLFSAFNIGQNAYSLEELKQYPGCEISAPRPVYISRKHSNPIDICHKRLIANYAHILRLHNLRTRYLTAKKNDRKCRNLEKAQIYNHNVYKLAESLEKNPDPYFHCNYDYYFTGGNISLFPYDQDFARVIHVDGINSSNLNISRFCSSTNNETATLVKETSRISEGDTEILQVLPLHISNDQNSFAVRKNDRVTFYLMKNNAKIKPYAQLKSKRFPFISFAAPKIDADVFLVGSVDQHVRVFDIKNVEPKLVQLYKCRSPIKENVFDGWNAIKSWQDNTSFLFANEKEICLMDLRTTPMDWFWSQSLIENEYFDCDIISSIKKSKFDHLFYVGTSHKLHCLDARYISTNTVEKSAICTWTHQLEYSPALIDTMRDQDTEYIAISSTLSGDLHICELNRENNIGELIQNDNVDDDQIKYQYKSKCLPYQPPTLQEAFENARLVGKCIHPGSHFKNRIQNCTTGIKFYKNSDRNLLLVSSSNGDVYGHNITQRKSQKCEQRTNALSNQIMNDYEAEICNLEQPDLFYTDIFDKTDLKRIIRCRGLSEFKQELNAPTTYANEGKANKIRYSLGRWQKSIKELNNYKDSLAKDLLSIWNIDINYQTEDLELNQLANTTKTKPQRRSVLIVENWLTSNEAKKDVMTSVPMQNLRNELLTADDIVTAENTSNTKSKFKTTKKKKTSKYVKGF